jgi:hypothetical protein
MEAAQIWREHYDWKKNVQLSGRLCFSVGSNYNRKKLRPEKKVQSSRLTGRFFRRVQITTRKNHDRKNKRYSHLADGGGSDLAETLRPEKTYSRLAGYVFQRVQFTTGKN